MFSKLWFLIPQIREVNCHSLAKASALKSQCQSKTQNAFDSKMLDCPVIEISVGINDTSSYPYSTNYTRNGKLTIAIETER